MKRTFAKRGLMSLVSGFFLLGFLLFGTARAQAQSGWVTPDDAKTILTQQITDVYHPTILAGAPGQSAYDNAMRHAIYYKAIIRLITDGTSVETAVTKGMEDFSTTSDPSLQPGSKGGSQPSSNPLVTDATALLFN